MLAMPHIFPMKAYAALGKKYIEPHIFGIRQQLSAVHFWQREKEASAISVPNVCHHAWGQAQKSL